MVRGHTGGEGGTFCELRAEAGGTGDGAGLQHCVAGVHWARWHPDAGNHRGGCGGSIQEEVASVVEGLTGSE